MKRLITAVACLATIFTVQAQVSIYNAGYFFAKEYSKELSLYKAKTFVMEEVLGVTTDAVKFEIDALASANSGELTTLVYKCGSINKSGLILGFYGNKITAGGMPFQTFGFKVLPIDKANSLIDKIESVTKENSKYIDADLDNNNIYFHFDDMTVLIYNTSMTTRLRIYWEGFDSELDWPTFQKTKRRLAKKLQ